MSSSLDHLRIVSETARYLQKADGDREAQRRRNESVRRAAQEHPLQQVAEAAEMSPEQLVHLLEEGPPGAKRHNPIRLFRRTG